MTPSELRALLDRTMSGDAPHVEKLTVSGAVISELFVEVPGNGMSDPVETVSVGPLQLRVPRREIVLADRIIGIKHWRTTAHGAQALALLSTLGSSLDEDLLRDRLRAESAEDALDALGALAARESNTGSAELEEVLRVIAGPLRRCVPITSASTTSRPTDGQGLVQSVRLTAGSQTAPARTAPAPPRSHPW